MTEPKPAMTSHELAIEIANQLGAAEMLSAASMDTIPIIEKLIDLYVKVKEAEARRDAIEQCAVEAGERSPERVSSHTMLGDMWDRRIGELDSSLAAARAELEKLR